MKKTAAFTTKQILLTLALAIVLFGLGCHGLRTSNKSVEPSSSVTQTNDSLLSLPPKHVEIAFVPTDPPSQVQIVSYAKSGSFQHITQLHSHTHRQEDGAELSLTELVTEYQRRGFRFISVTEHDRGHRKIGGVFVGAFHKDTPCDMLFEDPHIAGISIIPGEEGGRWSEPHERHMLEIGLKDKDNCRISPFDPRTRALYMKLIGGFTVAAHPGSGMILNPQAEGEWSKKELFDTPWLGGIELRDQSNVDLWNSLLTSGRMMWGFTVDDTHDLADIGKGWVVFYSDSPTPTVDMAVDRLRVGDFYSILPYRDGGTGGYIPKMYQPSLQSGELVFRFTNATKAELHFRDGLPIKSYDSLVENETTRIAYKVKGDEGFVRIELFSAHGHRAFGQPVFVLGRSAEDALPLDWAAARIQPVLPNFYAIGDSLGMRFKFTSRQQAEQALSVIKTYKIDRQCYVGRPYPRMQYLTVSGQAPVGPQQGENSITFDPAKLAVRYVEEDPPYIPGETKYPKGWMIVDEHGTKVEDCGDSEVLARRALEMIKRYGFTHRCVIGGEGEFGMVYYRK